MTCCSKSRNTKGYQVLGERQNTDSSSGLQKAPTLPRGSCGTKGLQECDRKKSLLFQATETVDLCCGSPGTLTQDTMKTLV